MRPVRAKTGAAAGSVAAAAAVAAVVDSAAAAAVGAVAATAAVVGVAAVAAITVASRPRFGARALSLRFRGEPHAGWPRSADY